MKSIMLSLAALSILWNASAAVELRQGDIVAPQSDNNGTVIVIDPSTGNRQLLSLYPSVGTGPQMSRPTSIAMLPDDNFLVTDTFAHNALTLIDATTGNRTDITTGDFQTVLLDGGDPILVGDGSVYRVNLGTGIKTLISGQNVGSGPQFSFGGAGGAVLANNGDIVVASYGSSALYEINPFTGARSILSGMGQGSGPAFSNLLDVVALPNGQLIAEGRNFSVSPFVNELYRVDAVTGDRTVISTGAYPDNEYERLALRTNGQLLGSVATLNAIFSINPSNGARTLVSGDGLGSGPNLFWGDMVVVPEPSTIALAALGVALLLVRRWRRIASLAVALVPVLAPLAASAQVTINWSPVGNPGNAADLTTGSLYGAVPYSYNIGTYDVTVAQYVDFLNSNDPTAANTLGLYNSDMATSSGISNHGAGNGNRYFYTNTGPDPVTNVTWYDAIRFANWLDNGQVPGSTETGAYTLGPLEAGGVPINGHSITRNAGATVFLPSENEWYKAAYYNPAANPATYYQYPTSSNTVPTASGPTATPNSANYNSVDTVTPVGAYIETTSPYGAFDMGGNVDQWNETFMSGSSRGCGVVRSTTTRPSCSPRTSSCSTR